MRTAFIVRATRKGYDSDVVTETKSVEYAILIATGLSKVLKKSDFVQIEVEDLQGRVIEAYRLIQGRVYHNLEGDLSK